MQELMSGRVQIIQINWIGDLLFKYSLRAKERLGTIFA